VGRRPPRLFYCLGQESRKKAMSATVAQFVRILERLAPPRLAEGWDSVGLQIGHRDWPVNKVWTALDPLPEVVAAACENEVDLLVTHHPLFFKAIKRIDCQTPQGRIAEMALSGKLAIYSAHTNLDSVRGGVNEALAGRMGLTNLRALVPSAENNICKLVVFVPESHLQAVLDALFALGVGRIDNYSCCTFRSRGVGTFLPGAGASPAVGQGGELTEVAENRIEVRLDRAEIAAVVDALRAVHPYESMAYDVYPLGGSDPRTGLGRVGELPSALPLADLAKNLKADLRLGAVRATGDLQREVTRLALCTGSGSSLLAAAIASGAQAYVSGDLGYHTARDAQQAGIGLIDIGHFGSEHLIVDVLAASLRSACQSAGLSVIVEAAGMEADPFHYL
jgi:dinuclear metal center YbgI/SA1388 family protein